jgi:hypothetical protein
MDSNWLLIMPHPNFDRYIPEYHFLHFREFLPYIFQDKSIKDTDPWWKFSGTVKEFNEHQLPGAKVKASQCAPTVHEQQALVDFPIHHLNKGCWTHYVCICALFLLSLFFN